MWPDLLDQEPTKLLCFHCLRPTHYALNTDRYVCPMHGPVLTTHFLESFYRPLDVTLFRPPFHT